MTDPAKVQRALNEMVDFMDKTPVNSRTRERGGIIAAATNVGVGQEVAEEILSRLVPTHLMQTQNGQTPEKDLFVLSTSALSAKKTNIQGI